MSNLKLGVVGAGFVGSAVINGFDTSTVDMWVVDPQHSDITLTDCLDKNPHLVFICLPTPQAPNGNVDVSVVVGDEVAELVNVVLVIVVVGDDVGVVISHPTNPPAV